jgi:Domain of unknown function (DUF4349)
VPGRERGRPTMTTSRTRRGLVCAAAAFTVLTLAACSEAAGEGSGTAGGAGATSDFDAQSGAGTTTDQAKVPAPQAPGVVAEGDANALATGALDDRSIIRTGTVRLRSDEVERAALEAAAAARALGGLVSGEQTVTDPADPDRTVAELTLRVPSARFDDLLVKVRGLGTVLEQTQQAADVTGQVADVDARVEAQRASVRRIQALLARANTIGEVVTVEGQLAQRQADLESLEAQQKALKDQTSLATLEVSVVGPDPVGTQDDATGFLAGLDRGWHAFTVALTAGLTAVGALLPFVGFGLLVLLPVLAWLRSRTRRTTVQPLPPAPYEPPVREDQPVG